MLKLELLNPYLPHTHYCTNINRHAQENGDTKETVGHVSLSVNEKLTFGQQPQKIVAETGILKRTLEKIVANEAKIRESITEIDEVSFVCLAFFS